MLRFYANNRNRCTDFFYIYSCIATFPSFKTPPFVSNVTKLTETGPINKSAMFCGKTSLRSFCGTTTEPHIFYLSSSILSVCKIFFARQQNNGVGADAMGD